MWTRCTAVTYIAQIRGDSSETSSVGRVTAEQQRSKIGILFHASHPDVCVCFIILYLLVTSGTTGAHTDNTRMSGLDLRGEEVPSTEKWISLDEWIVPRHQSPKVGRLLSTSAVV